MSVPAGYLTKNKAAEYIMQHTVFGRRSALRKIEEMASKGEITIHPNPGNPQATLISMPDVEKVVAALTMPPVE
jgi:histidinol-phosphate/aromatic aminotransferase/cobyric acid decarboxylase-like protein